MKVWLLLGAAVLAAAPSLRLEPAVITACANSAGQATVFWNGDGAAPVTVFANDTPMTGAEPVTGFARTGDWVTDGMVFTLRNSSGQTLVSVTASVQCGGPAWWPLDVGNEWRFRRNDRVVTGEHSVWRVIRKELVNGVEWSVLQGAPASFTRLRNGDGGRIYSLSTTGVETVVIDPAAGVRKPFAQTLAGTFTEEVSWQGPIVILGRDSGTLVRGVGPSYYQTDVIAGSSGGFGVGYTLLEAVIGGARFTPNYPQVGLTLETVVANLSAKSTRNCALPCYFVACFGADLPDTYKPCIEASVAGSNGRLALLNPAGTPVFETAASGWVRIPLYRAPATPLPAGNYSVTATVNGATMTLPLEIR